MMSDEVAPEVKEEALYYLGLHKGRAEALSGLGLYESKHDNPVVESARARGWRQADSNPEKYNLAEEVQSLENYIARTEELYV